MEITGLLEYNERRQLRAWFERNATTERCCRIAMYRGKNKPERVCLPYLDVVEEASIKLFVIHFHKRRDVKLVTP